MNGCGMCIDSHERVLLEHGVKPRPIQSAVRIGAVMKAIATVHATLRRQSIGSSWGLVHR